MNPNPYLRNLLRFWFWVTEWSLGPAVGLRNLQKDGQDVRDKTCIIHHLILPLLASPSPAAASDIFYTKHQQALVRPGPIPGARVHVGSDRTGADRRRVHAAGTGSQRVRGVSGVR